MYVLIGLGFFSPGARFREAPPHGWLETACRNVITIRISWATAAFTVVVLSVKARGFCGNTFARSTSDPRTVCLMSPEVRFVYQRLILLSRCAYFGCRTCFIQYSRKAHEWGGIPLPILRPIPMMAAFLASNLHSAANFASDSDDGCISYSNLHSRCQFCVRFR